ncbi:hypothetical protein AB0C02_16965 [Micromonospora sp. NPDC048999]|uniref:hypothetical protein n=1 Tax=Micromonospora sp. NPDC048999 TaxID=3155391 RepID=UPI0033DF5766
MSKHRLMPDEAPQTATDDSGAAYWSVADGDWPAVRPSLPAEMVDLLAPPIVVGVARVVATSRLTPPADAALPPRTTGTGPSGAAGSRPAPGATTVRLTASTVARPATPAPGSRAAAGRHRSATAGRSASPGC